MSTVGIYTRVSSKQQDAISQEADLKSWQLVNAPDAQRFNDKATGSNMNRPGFEKLMAGVRTGKIKTIVCWRLDRLGRTTRGLAELFAELLERKVNLVSVRDGLDLSTPAGRLMAHVLASVAQYETEIRFERQQAGIAAARAKGKHLGRPQGSGVEVDRDKVQLASTLKTNGKTVTDIASIMNISRPTVYRLLSFA